MTRRVDAQLLRELAEAQELPAGKSRARALWDALVGEGLTEGLCDDDAERLTSFGAAAAAVLAQALDERDAARRAAEDVKVRCNRGCWRADAETVR